MNPMMILLFYILPFALGSFLFGEIFIHVTNVFEIVATELWLRIAGGICLIALWRIHMRLK